MKDYQLIPSIILILEVLYIFLIENVDLSPIYFPYLLMWTWERVEHFNDYGKSRIQDLAYNLIVTAGDWRPFFKLYIENYGVLISQSFSNIWNLLENSWITLLQLYVYITVLKCVSKIIVTLLQSYKVALKCVLKLFFSFVANYLISPHLKPSPKAINDIVIILLYITAVKCVLEIVFSNFELNMYDLLKNPRMTLLQFYVYKISLKCVLKLDFSSNNLTFYSVVNSKYLKISPKLRIQNDAEVCSQTYFFFLSKFYF